MIMIGEPHASPTGGIQPYKLEDAGLSCLPPVTENTGPTVNQSIQLAFHCAAGFCFGERFLDFAALGRTG